jgi:hypothetical protein
MLGDLEISKRSYGKESVLVLVCRNFFSCVLNGCLFFFKEWHFMGKRSQDFKGC